MRSSEGPGELEAVLSKFIEHFRVIDKLARDFLITYRIVEAIRLAVTNLPPDVEAALRRALEIEDNPAARAQLEAILRNVEIARKTGRPICQDTGLIHYYVQAGAWSPILPSLREILIDATKWATREIPLRPNTVDPIRHVNPGDNTGRGAPIIDWEIADGDRIIIDIVPKGGGSEAVSVLRLPPPGRGLEALPEIVVDAVLSAGAKPCPPTIIGIGIGGGADTALKLAKKAASLRKLGTGNPDPFLAGLEEKIMEEVNNLGIGVMGLGGKTTVLGVHIDYAYRHPANYPVGIVFQCWATRRARVIIDPRGKVEIEQ